MTSLISIFSIFMPIFSVAGAIKRKVELQHFTDDELYLQLVRRYDVFFYPADKE